MVSRRLAPFLGLVLALGAAAPGVAADPSAAPGASSAASPAPSESPSVAATLPDAATTFGEYTLVPLLTDKTPYAGPTTPTSLTGVAVGPDVAEMLKDPAVQRALVRNGFVIVPAEMPRFAMAYDTAAYTGTPAFVTTDAAYHTWHLVFDKVLRTVETKQLSPALAKLLTGMLANARTQATDLAGTALEEPANHVLELLQVAGSQLKLDVGTLSPDAKAELALIAAHDQITRSPILGTDIDYSLYTPRGHYTKSKALTRYFLAMSVLGQTAFALPGALQADLSLADATGLRTAALATRTLVGHRPLERLWGSIYEPTAFLVGLSDDYSPFELATAITTAVPGGMADPSLLTDDAAIDAVAAALTTARPVRIDPERPSVRLMGTRFVIDSWVLDQLVAPNVGTEAKPRLLASPLDLAAAFGSRLALRTQRAAGEAAYVNYESQMQAMREAIAARPDAAWGGTVYDAWLAAIEPMWLPHGVAFPDFMRRWTWSVKDQQTGFGSYAELRHDTILYVKQFMGEMGDAGPNETPRSWVEPDPVPFARLQAMADLARDGLGSRKLLSKDLDRLLADYSDFVGFLARIATDELAGRPISADDNEALLTVGGTLEDFWWRTSDLPGGAIPEMDSMGAIVADIGAGRDRTTGKVTALEIGTGWVDDLLVLVPDDAGRFHVARGGVYSYYEFQQPIADRLTDEAWRAMLKNGEEPDRPAWVMPIIR